MSLVRFANASDAIIYVSISSDVRILESYSESESRSALRKDNWKVVQPELTYDGATIGGGELGWERTSEEKMAAEYSKAYFVEKGPMAGARRFYPNDKFEITIPYEDVPTFYVTVLDENYGLVQGLTNLAFSASKQNNLFYSKRRQVLEAEVVEKSLLTNASGIVLKFGDKMLGRPITKKNWPASSFAMSGHTHFIHCRKKEVVSGETVRITSNKSKEGYVYLYSSDKGWIYYDQKSSNQKQFWIIEKVGGTTGDKIRSGDEIQLRNAYFSDSYLRRYSDTYPSCEAKSEGSKITVEVKIPG